MKIPSEIERYILEHIDAQDPVLAALERETSLKVINPRMLSGHLQGEILAMLSKMIRPLSILEIGTFTGYSAICLARGLRPGGRLITIEVNDELETIAARYFEKAGLNVVIGQRIGPALEILPTLQGPFDLVYIDADKREYVAYYQQVLDKVAPGGWVLADNTLWDGKIIGGPEAADHQTRGILEFNDLVASDQRVEKIILPVRDGITILRKKE
jgi:predicted O-methyltransferase YrrM